MKTYAPKSLITGDKLGQDPSTLWVAVPDKYAGAQIMVEYSGTRMLIKDWKKEAKEFKRFRDKFWKEGSGRSQFYTLGYFKFSPEGEN